MHNSSHIWVQMEEKLWDDGDKRIGSLFLCGEKWKERSLNVFVKAETLLFVDVFAAEILREEKYSWLNPTCL